MATVSEAASRLVQAYERVRDLEQQLAAAQAEAAKWQRAAERSTELLSKVIACPVDCPVADGCTQDENGFDQCRERLLSWALQPEPETPAESEE